ncbi:hypothetical protein D187_003168 [Cystobacter fuscus DSM 2262]|uniref:Cyclic nucleotide-binding domain-containing protein n=1 Tax=Cystobacter fuscus (strain ATCC 25194 / DSM 2262 / NBRC 100088 / M29) TaxID=1242864 RepID=S9QD49_CYSF2|nr:cyclic nucleotide-binding domain-containing protein [Cystobacter fuscus]EPX59264.1 hypothetical protein D187_003168 [Cystobacter fuscus DSM 2262]
MLPAGRDVFQAGSASDELYLLEAGVVHVLAQGGKIMDELGSGAVFGELALLTRERRSATVHTATASTLIRIPRSALLPLLEENDRLRERMWKTLAERRFDDHAPRWGSQWPLTPCPWRPPLGLSSWSRLE